MESHEKFLEINLDSFDHIIIDLIDDRFLLAVFEDNSGFTVSNEFMSMGIDLDQLGVRKYNFQDAKFLNLWEDGLDKWRNKINFNPSKIILNKAFWAKRFESGKCLDNQKIIEKNNLYLSERYERLLQKLPIPNVIEYPQDIIYADENHRWGISPFHFNEKTELYGVKKLSSFLG